MVYKEICKYQKHEKAGIVMQEDADCKSKFTYAEKQIKVLSQRLDRIIPENSDQTVLYPKKHYELEVLENTLMTYRVLVKDMDSPARFTIGFDKTKETVDKPRLRMFTSFDDKEPHADKCLETFYFPAKQCRVFAPNKSRKFECKYLYVSLFSETGCSISLKLAFSEPVRTGLQKADKHFETIDFEDQEDPFKA